MKNYDRAKKIFNKAVRFPKSRVQDYLGRACGDDVELRAEVDKLLKNHEQNAPTVKEQKASTPRPADGVALGDAVPAIPGEYHAGDTVSHFTVRSVLGEGGMGLVYLAEQSQPVRRKVALKILKPGTDTRATLNRFQAEQQALAMMEHPGIAKVLEAGATREGRPWFAMEYINGAHLTRFCDEHQLDTRDRLALFASICDAVQHAHVKGIIHRDLKPGNILASTDEHGVPQSKIIDFGIAKAIGESLTEATLNTAENAVIGTIFYMSPEQIDGGLAVDTRSDVYSLGVILYQLLAGRLPFKWDNVKAMGLQEIKRVIREQVPAKPSTRLTALNPMEIAEIAACRRSQPLQLEKTLRRELEWIPMRALEKDPEERYPSAEAMARDIRNYLSDLALEAAPPTTSYRLQKFYGRNKVTVLTAASFVLLLLAATAISLTLWRTREAAYVQANRDNSVARDALEVIEEGVKNFNERAKKAGRPEERKRLTAALEEVLQGKEYERPVDTLVRELITQDEASRGSDRAANEQLNQIVPEPDEEGDLHFKKGDTGIKLANYKEAREHLEDALAWQRANTGEEDPSTLRTRAKIARLDHLEGKYHEGNPYDEIIAEYDELNRDDVNRDYWEARWGQGMLRLEQGYPPRAKRDLEDAYKNRIDFPEYRSKWSLGLGLYHLESAEYTDARKKLDEAKLKAVTPADEFRAMRALGQLHWALGDYDSARQRLGEALEGQQDNDSIGPQHPDTIRTLSALAELELWDDQHDVAREYLEEAKRENQLPDTHPDSIRLRRVEAELDLEQGHERSEDLGSFYNDQYDDWKDNHIESIRLKRVLGRSRLRAENTVAETVERSLIEVLKHFNSNTGDYRRDLDWHPDIILTRLALAEALAEAKEEETAISELNWANNQLAGWNLADHPIRLRCLIQMGDVLRRKKDYREAEKRYAEAWKISLGRSGLEHPQTQKALQKLTDLYDEDAWDKPEKKNLLSPLLYP
ncbi:MAG: serine/threonine-protein kinase [Phycisphaerales bacterium]|nr:serine/threonine-protein kinase [Phycisphaerales bacterium]